MSQVDVIERNMDGKNLQIGIVVSRFNEYAGKELYAACLEELKRLGVKEKHITKVTVPGALETPLVLSKLGVSRVALEYGIPIANGILTCYSDEQCKERTKIKGTDCAQCAVEMANLVAEFPIIDEFEDDDFNDD